jgi:hypothetical protein
LAFSVTSAFSRISTGLASFGTEGVFFRADFRGTGAVLGP